MSDKFDDEKITQLSDRTRTEAAEKGKKRLSDVIRRAASLKRADGKRLSTVSLIIIIVLALAALFTAVDSLSGGLLTSMNGRVVAFFTSGSAEKFDIGELSSPITDFAPYSSSYAVLTQDAVSFVNSSGSVISRQQLSYSSPSMRTASGRMLIFDRGSDIITLMSGREIGGQRIADGSVVDADISSRGNYAAAVIDDSGVYSLCGYNGQGVLIYKWLCRDGYISSLKLNSGGDKALACVVTAQNAALVSRLYILDFDYDSEYACFEYPGEAILKVRFLNDSRVQVVTDCGVYLIKDDEQETVCEYGSADIVLCGICDDSYTAIVLNDYSQDGEYRLLIFSKSGSLRSEALLSGSVRALSVSKKSVAVLYSDKLETFTARGKLVGSAHGVNHYDSIVLDGNYAYVVSADGVKKYPAYATGSDRAAETVSQGG